jgi:hypothetical protein
MDLKNGIDLFTFFIIFIKILFIFAAICYFALNHFHVLNITNKNRLAFETKFAYWKERTEFIFTICMAVLLIYYFRPANRHAVNNETAILFFLFGIILIFTAKWGLFVTEAPWYKTIVSSWA